MPSAPQGPPEPAPPSAPPPAEHFGPLLLERIVKDDGRALIRYTRVDPVEPPKR
jgi:hypothetical protein